jgi:hypothetical protein
MPTWGGRCVLERAICVAHVEEDVLGNRDMAEYQIVFSIVLAFENRAELLWHNNGNRD